MNLRVLGLLFILILTVTCGKNDSQSFQGYVEVDFIYPSSLESGRLLSIDIERGSKVVKNQIIARLDDTEARAVLAQTQAKLAHAQSDLADLQKGQRPEELEIMRRLIEQAKARIKLPEPRVERRRTLVKQNIVGQEAVDEAEAAIAEDRQRLAEMEARLRVAEMPAREDQVKAANAQIEAEQAAIKQAQWVLDQHIIYAPEDGRIEDVYFRPGEHVEPGQPLAQLFSPQRLKIRFFITEPFLSKISLNQEVSVHCDSCPPNQKAIIRFIANQPEYTPPVIYSRESRAKLVYLVEAYPIDSQLNWHPGQPIDIYLRAQP